MLQLHSTPPTPRERPAHPPLDDVQFPPELDPPPPSPLPEPIDEDAPLQPPVLN